MTQPTDSLRRMFDEMERIALEELEKFESEGKNPLHATESVIFGEKHGFDVEDVADLLFPLAIFSEPRAMLQADFQKRIYDGLPDASSKSLYNQLKLEGPKIWSYRDGIKTRGIAHTPCGPKKNIEMTFDGIVRRCCDKASKHVFCLGWALYNNGSHILLAYREFSFASVVAVESFEALPIHDDDDLFWKESLVALLRLITGRRAERFSAEYASCDNRPEVVAENLSRIINVLELGDANRSLRALIPTAVSEDDVKRLSRVIDFEKRRYFKDINASSMPDDARVLRAFGLETDGSMPAAHPQILLNDPVAVLLPERDHPFLKENHERDSIRTALLWEKEHSTNDALLRSFRIYEREKRFLATFANRNIRNPKHLQNYSVPLLIRDLNAVFPLSFAHSVVHPFPESVTSLIPSLSPNRLTDARFSNVSSLLLESRNRCFVRDLRAELTEHLLAHAANYRNAIAEVEKNDVKRVLKPESRQKLTSGLDALSKIFGI